MSEYCIDLSEKLIDWESLYILNVKQRVTAANKRYEIRVTRQNGKPQLPLLITVPLRVIYFAKFGNNLFASGLLDIHVNDEEEEKINLVRTNLINLDKFIESSLSKLTIAKAIPSISEYNPFLSVAGTYTKIDKVDGTSKTYEQGDQLKVGFRSYVEYGVPRISYPANSNDTLLVNKDGVPMEDQTQDGIIAELSRGTLIKCTLMLDTISVSWNNAKAKMGMTSGFNLYSAQKIGRLELGPKLNMNCFMTQSAPSSTNIQQEDADNTTTDI